MSKNLTSRKVKANLQQEMPTDNNFEELTELVEFGAENTSQQA